MVKVAVIGSGISGLAAAHTLRAAAEVTLFESGSYFGGHTHTVDVTLPTPNGDITHGVDTGFLVFNDRTYPELIKLFSTLNVTTAKSDMSFSVQSQNSKSGERMEWSGTSLNALFAQRSNLISWRFWRMLRHPALQQLVHHGGGSRHGYADAPNGGRVFNGAQIQQRVL